jgi:thioredoxin-like negative regulator of GroEL
MEGYKYDVDVLSRALDYKNYRLIIDKLLAEGKTSGEDHSPFMVSYTHKNVERMEALDAQVEITDVLVAHLRQLKSKYIFLVLTEAWCGDAAQIIPVLDKIAEASEGKITLRLIWRDTNPDIMQRHLTNGGKSIPKLILIKEENLQEISNWGPRPDVLQALANDWKNAPGYSLKSWAEKLHMWYAENKTAEIQKEIGELLRDCD